MLLMRTSTLSGTAHRRVGWGFAAFVLFGALAVARPVAAQPQTTAWGCPEGFAPTLIDFTFEAANPMALPLAQGTEIGFDDDTAPPAWTCPVANGSCIFEPAADDFSQGCDLSFGGTEAACEQPWSTIGVYLHYDLIEADRGAFNDNSGADDSRGPMMLFDTGSTANGDSDLRSPHGGHGTSTGCPAGSPGVGDPQAGPGRFYANCPADIPDDPLGDPSGDLDDPDDGLNNPLQLVVILSTNGDRTSPNDDADGGVIIVLFPDFATTILRVSSVDIDTATTRRQIRLFSDLYGANLIPPAPGTGCDPDNQGTPPYNDTDTELELGDPDCSSNINPITNTQHVDADTAMVTASTDDDALTLGDNTLVIQTDINLLFQQVDPSVMADGGQLVRRMEFEILGSGSLDELVYCRQESFTPVTLARFAAERMGRGARFTWTTATETGTAGFHLYEETRDGWRRLTDSPVPSRTVDSTVPQEYRFDAPHATGTRFRIEDVSVRGVRTIRGVVEIDSVAGEAPPAEAVPWGAIRAEHETKRALRGQAEVARAARVPAAVSAGSLVAELAVDRDGLYRVTHEHLLAHGVDLTGARFDQLALTRHLDTSPPSGERQAVPLWIETAGRRSFGPGSFIEFLGEARDSLYTRTNLYRLELDAKRARRIEPLEQPLPSRNYAPLAYQETFLVDEDRAYSAGSATGDPWYNERLIAFGSPASTTVPLKVDHMVGLFGGAGLHLRLSGASNLPEVDPDHHVQVKLNGRLVADERFDGAEVLELAVALEPGTLREGTNALELTLPFDHGVIADIVDLDVYGVSYPRGFQARGGELAFRSRGREFRVGGMDAASGVSVYARGPAAGEVTRLGPVELGRGIARFAGIWGHELDYLVVAEEAVRVPEVSPGAATGDGLLTGAADLLIISHPDFLGPPPAGMLGLDDLILARESGAQPLTVKVAGVDEVFGRYTGGNADAEAVRAYIRDAEAALGVRYVLLVGGDTYDYHDNLGLGSVSFVPTAYVETGEQFPVRFTPSDAWLADLDGDRVPDLPIGRLPVRTSAELDSVLAKILLYPSALHQKQALLVADETDGGLSFGAVSESLRGELPAGWQATTAYADELGVGGARAQALDRINQGVAITSFVGHSGPSTWGQGLLSSSQVETGLSNPHAPTVVTQWGCWNTYYVEPALNTMAHKFLLGTVDPSSGAAAVLGSSTLTEVYSDIALGPELFDRMLEPGMRLGDAVQQAKAAVAAVQPRMSDVILGWALLGDPTLVIDE